MLARLVVLFLLLLLGAAPAGAQWFGAIGLIRPDLGLHEIQDGFHLGIGYQHPLGSGAFDVAWSAEYQVRSGSQPMIFSDPRRGQVQGQAEVTLGTLQPVLSLGWRAVRGYDLTIRPWIGASAALNINESWKTPDGATARVYSYESLDLMVHAGLNVSWRQLMVEVRASQGLLEQLIDRDYTTAGGWPKANNPLPGVETPVAGSKVNSVQVGVGAMF